MTAHRPKVITETRRRRWFSKDDKVRIVEETLALGVVVSEIARRHGSPPQQVLAWRRQARQTPATKAEERQIVAHRGKAQALGPSGIARVTHGYIHHHRHVVAIGQSEFDNTGALFAFIEIVATGRSLEIIRQTVWINCHDGGPHD